MDVREVMNRKEGYYAGYSPIYDKLQKKAKRLCCEYNMTFPEEEEKRIKILKELFGTYNPSVFVEPDFRCDYGFNIHFHGFALLNYNCVILDTSCVHIGDHAFIAPGVCITCAGHAIDPKQRLDGVGTSKPITIEDNVWIGANSVICGGVTIGNGSVIGAGSVVVNDIPAGVVAVGNPCRVLRTITEADEINERFIIR